MVVVMFVGALKDHLRRVSRTVAHCHSQIPIVASGGGVESIIVIMDARELILVVHGCISNAADEGPAANIYFGLAIIQLSPLPVKMNRVLEACNAAWEDHDEHLILGVVVLIYLTTIDKHFGLK